MHATAAGKALLAALPPSRTEEILDQHETAPETENTITSREQLMDELEEIEEQGLAYNDEEYIRNLRSIGTAVRGENDAVVGAITVSGPANRLSDTRIRQELTDELLAAKNELELKIQYSDDY